MVGDIEDLGLLLGATALAIFVPSLGTFREKSVISLFNRNPEDQRCDPNTLSIVAVIETAFPSKSIIEICVVPDASSVLSFHQLGIVS